jgi:hypothetical protein
VHCLGKRGHRIPCFFLICASACSSFWYIGAKRSDNFFLTNTIDQQKPKRSCRKDRIIDRMSDKTMRKFLVL